MIIIYYKNGNVSAFEDITIFVDKGSETFLLIDKNENQERGKLDIVKRIVAGGEEIYIDPEEDNTLI